MQYCGIQFSPFPFIRQRGTFLGNAKQHIYDSNIVYKDGYEAGNRDQQRGLAAGDIVILYHDASKIITRHEIFESHQSDVPGRC